MPAYFAHTLKMDRARTGSLSLARPDWNRSWFGGDEAPGLSRFRNANSDASGVMWCPLKVPVGELLVGVANGQHKIISEGSADDLQAQR